MCGGKEGVMRYLVTAGEMRRYETNTIDKIGIPAIVLMERAALAAMEAVERYIAGQSGRKRELTALVMAGMGNNGGDGLALSRLLAEKGFSVEVWCVGEIDKATELWRRQRKILQSYPVEFVTWPKRGEYTVIIDALFGIGLSRNIAGVFLEAVERFCGTEGYRIALDIPSGVDADTGRLWGDKIVRADETVVFGFCKPGLVLSPGCRYAGKLTVADIGIPQGSFFGQYPALFALDGRACDLLPGRDPDGNKGTFGKVLLAAGSLNMAGAAVLAAKAAYRSGAGMVKVITAPQNREILQIAVPEALVGTWDDLGESLMWADAIAAGPGLGRDDSAREALRRTIEESEKPLLVDADGLNLLAREERLAKCLSKQGAEGRQIVLTPHMGELSRLTGEKIETLKAGRQEYARELAKRFHAVAVVKDSRTFISGESGPVCVNLSGNSGMATAGSGDVLAGVIVGLMAQEEDPFRAACLGAYLHGTAGDLAAARCGEHACMALDIVECLKTGNDCKKACLNLCSEGNTIPQT